MFEYSKKQCEAIMNHCASGKSLESYCAKIRVSPKTINHWYQEHPEFKEAVEMCPCLELLFWEERLLDAMEKKEEGTYPLGIIKSRIDNLMKYVTSPIKKETYNDFKEDNQQAKIRRNDDMLEDFNLLGDSHH
jgi:hypothetical protein